MKTVVLDIETENTDFDIMKHNKRILSVQLLDEYGCRIYCDDAKGNDMDAAKKDLRLLIDDGKFFIGYNIVRFDVFFIKKFLDINIPPPQIIDISEMKQVDYVRQKLMKQRPSLEECCKCLGIICEHKDIMNRRGDKLREDHALIERAEAGALQLQKEKGWSADFAYDYALRKICVGTAILESYKEYVAAGYDKGSDFYKYAVGDVFSEHDLYEKLGTIVNYKR